MREMLTQKLGNRNLKGFVKEMPKVSRSEAEAEFEAESKPKTRVSRMGVAEINKLLGDFITRKEIMPQLWNNSKYELIPNEYGEIIAVKLRSDGG